MRRILSLMLASFLLPVTSALAQRPADVVHWTAKGPSASVRAGGVARVQLTADVEEGWHLYALTQAPDGPPPMGIAVAKGQPFTINVKDIDAPAPTVASDPNFGTETQYYEGKTTMNVPLAARRDAKTGKYSVPIEVTFQVCSNRMCLRPFTQPLPVEVTVAAPAKEKTP